MIRVLLVDDEQLVRSGIRGLLALRDDLEVIGQAASGEAAQTMTRALQPDVVLRDVRMPAWRHSGTAAARRSRSGAADHSAYYL